MRGRKSENDYVGCSQIFLFASFTSHTRYVCTSQNCGVHNIIPSAKILEINELMNSARSIRMFWIFTVSNPPLGSQHP